MCAYVDETSHALLQRPHPRTRSWIVYSFGLREPVVIELRREGIVGASNVMEYTVVVVINALLSSLYCLWIDGALFRSTRTPVRSCGSEASAGRELDMSLRA